jgi:glucoamylase
MWTFVHQLRHIAEGKTLRIIVAADAKIVWSADGWAATNTIETTKVNALTLWFADLPTAKLPRNTVIEFTFFWKETRRWEGKNSSIAIVSPK